MLDAWIQEFNSHSVSYKIDSSIVPSCIICNGLRQYTKQLQFATSSMAFHRAHPVGRFETGFEVEAKDAKPYPTFARESLEKAVTEILVPLLSLKKMSSLHGHSNPTEISFVKEPAARLLTGLGILRWRLAWPVPGQPPGAAPQFNDKFMPMVAGRRAHAPLSDGRRYFRFRRFCCDGRGPAARSAKQH